MNDTCLVMTGCFDVLHPGHAKILKSFREYPSEHKYIYLNSDDYIKSHKHRNPVFNFAERSCILQCFVGENTRIIQIEENYSLDSYIYILRSNHNKLVRMIGGDYMDNAIVGKDYFDEIIFIARNDGYSTTDVVNRIKNA